MDTDPVGTALGSASAVITDDATSQGALRSHEGAPYRAAAAGTFSGSFTSEAQVEISMDGSTWVDLGSPSQVSVMLQSSGGESTVHSNASVPVGTYTHARLRLSGGQASVDAGAVLGGVSFTGAVDIQVGGTDQEVVIEKQVQPFTLTADTQARIIFDLNSEAWVDEENADDQSADDEEVEDSATAHREVESREQPNR